MIRSWIPKEVAGVRIPKELRKAGARLPKPTRPMVLTAVGSVFGAAILATIGWTRRHPR